MEIKIVKDYKEMSLVASRIFIDRIKKAPNMKLGLATGGTPEGTYQELIQDYQEYGTSYQQITTFNLDEYWGLSGEHPNSYRYYMNTHFFDHIDIKKENTFIPKGDGSNPAEECERYEQLLAAKGGVDLQLLGIGSNGHIGFNEPGTPFDSSTHLVDLAPTTRKANARFFPSLEDVPKQAITMGMATIMKSKEILLLISGDRKKESAQRLVYGEVSEDFPASILKQHPNVTILIDQAAAGTINRTSTTKHL